MAASASMSSHAVLLPCRAWPRAALACRLAAMGLVGGALAMPRSAAAIALSGRRAYTDQQAREPLAQAQVSLWPARSACR